MSQLTDRASAQLADFGACAAFCYSWNGRNEPDRTQRVSMPPPKGLRAHRAQQVISAPATSTVAADLALV